MDFESGEVNPCTIERIPDTKGRMSWFMAIMVAMFHSQHSREILSKSMNNWNLKPKLSKLLKNFFYQIYEKGYSDSDETILKLLYETNPEMFMIDPSFGIYGVDPIIYIGKLYKLLNVDYILYDYNPADDVLFYSYLNENLNNASYRIAKRNIVIEVEGDRKFKYVEEDIIPPPILMVIVREESDTGNATFNSLLFPNNTIDEGVTKESLKSMNEQIFFKGFEYNLDAVLLANWNIGIGHAIAGITCKKKKYIYNGWTRTSMDPSMINQLITRKIPCELMKYDWNIKNDGDFCLNTAKCIPEVLKHQLKDTDICFNFSKGERLLIYVRKDAKSNTSADSYTNVSKSPNKIFSIGGNNLKKNTILNPKPSKSSKLVIKPLKKCPEGKILNPKKSCCIVIKNN